MDGGGGENGSDDDNDGFDDDDDLTSLKIDTWLACKYFTEKFLCLPKWHVTTKFYLVLHVQRMFLFKRFVGDATIITMKPVHYNFINIQLTLKVILCAQIF